MKFTKKTKLEAHLIKNYVNQKDCDVPFELQYVNVSSKGTENLAEIYQLYKKRQWSSTESEKEKSRKRSSTETAKEKCRKRMSTEKEKEKNRKRMSTEKEKEKNRKRMSTEKEKEKCRKRKSTEKEQKCSRIRKKKMRAYSSGHSEWATIELVNSFKEAIKEGPYYFCVVCNRSLYRKTVKLFSIEHYKQDVYHAFTPVKCFDSLKYICLTCDRHLKKGSIPCQAVWNKLQLDELPHEINILNRLEKVLIAKRILFKKISIMPRGQQPKVIGAVCNVPVRADKVSECLPRGMDSNGIILVKLKRKLLFRGHVYFESVRPEYIRSASGYLKNSNPFYSNILIKVDNIDKELLSLSDIDAAVEVDCFPTLLEANENSDDLERENPLQDECTNTDEMCAIPNIYSEDQGVLDLAPGENKRPEPFFQDNYCEEQAFPYLLPRGKFGLMFVGQLNYLLLNISINAFLIILSDFHHAAIIFSLHIM